MSWLENLKLKHMIGQGTAKGAGKAKFCLARVMPEALAKFLAPLSPLSFPSYSALWMHLSKL